MLEMAPAGHAGLKHTRWSALDRLRALAVVFMIQGHTFTALLRPDALPQKLSHLHSVLHGLTAPAFLFGAGLAFGTATYGQYERHRRLGSTVAKRFRRYLVLIVLGYALQLPGGSLWAGLHAEGAQLASICRVGPLQLVAVTLGLCQLLILLLPDARRHALASALLGLTVMLLASVVARSGAASQLGPLFGAYLDDTGGAHFPLFPWSAFTLLGVGCAGLMREHQQLRRALPLALTGGVCALAAYFIFQAAAAQTSGTWDWRSSPSYFLFRLGMVVLMLGLLHRRADTEPRSDARAGWSATLATHSLVAYVVHLHLLYGSPVTPRLAVVFGKTLGIGQTSLVCAAIVALTLAITRLWDILEHRQLVVPRFKQAGLALLALSVLIR